MDVITALKQRKSIRKFKPEPVPKKILEEILEAAVRAPSSMNTQAWEITVVGGDVLDKIKQANIQALTSGKQSGGSSRPFEGVYRERQVRLGKELFRLMDIGREDKVKRTDWIMRGYRFFDAPAAFILSIDKSLASDQHMSDVGGLSQSICLAALNYGLGTCIHSQGSSYPDLIREFTGIPESKRIVISISIGYPDWDFPANQLVSEREPLAGSTTWVGFD